MADDDFEIDLYGDDTIEDNPTDTQDTENGSAEDDVPAADSAAHESIFGQGYDDHNQEQAMDDAEQNTSGEEPADSTDLQEGIQPDSNENAESTPQPQQEKQQIESTTDSANGQNGPPRQKVIPQGTKRGNAEGVDDRPIDPGATPALRITDLHWWTTEEDIRGWANQETCEDEVKSVTYNEHKVNGKSKR